MNVDSWLKQAKTHKNLRLDAELILLEALGKSDRTFLVGHGDYKLSVAELKKADELFLRRKNGEPLAYIFGFKEFYGRRFLVDKNVLIPRPETEEIIEIIKKLKPKRILDVGTGSGCVAVTLKLENPEAEVFAVDVSGSALKKAKENAENFSADVNFLKSDLLDRVDENFDVIVANLPYVDKNWEWIKKDELGFEPELALYAENGGLELIFKLLKQAENRCQYLILEADPCQHERIIAEAEKNGFKNRGKDGFILTFLSKCDIMRR